MGTPESETDLVFRAYPNHSDTPIQNLSLKIHPIPIYSIAYYYKLEIYLKTALKFVLEI